MPEPIPLDEWIWFGHPGHFICARWCHFQMCTQVGNYLISTVGEWTPDEPMREIMADSRGITLEGRGDARLADYMKKVGFEELGFNRTYETFVFKAGAPCKHRNCGCGLPEIDGSEIDSEGYYTAPAATKGHIALCQKWAGITGEVEADA